MTKKSLLKIMGIAPLFIFVLASQLWRMTFEVKMAILLPVILIGLTSVLLMRKENKQPSSYRYLSAALGFSFVVFIFFYQYFS